MKNIIVIIIIFWIFLAALRTFYNFSKIFTEEGRWIRMSIDEKKGKLFGEEYVYYAYLSKLLTNDSRVVVFSDDAKPYLIGRYQLYPMYVVHVRSYQSLKDEIRRRPTDVVMLYKLSEMEIKNVEKIIGKKSTKFSENINFIKS